MGAGAASTLMSVGTLANTFASFATGLGGGTQDGNKSRNAQSQVS